MTVYTPEVEASPREVFTVKNAISFRTGWPFGLGFIAVCLVAGEGCARLKLQTVDASVRKPSNVAVYFTVDTTSGEPVANLQPTDFLIYEDAKPVSVLESKQTILQEQIAAIHYTLLLVDMSGSVVGSGDMPTLMSAASAFADRVGPYQKVALYTFDGSPHINPVVSFGGNVRAGVAALAHYRPRDPSTNLNGGVVEAVKVLSREMDSASQPLRFGTLVVFTDGTDRAHRVSEQEVKTTLDTAAFDTFAIGVGAEVDTRELAAIGRSGIFASKNREDIARGFDDVATRIEAASRRFYLLSYCSPSRAGEHDVEIEAVSNNKRGRLRHHFNAAGFGPNCDPNQKPAFDVRHPHIRAPEAETKRVANHPAAPVPAPARAQGTTPVTGPGAPNWRPER